MSTPEVTERHRLTLLRAVLEFLQPGMAGYGDTAALQRVYNRVTDEIMDENEAEIKRNRER